LARADLAVAGAEASAVEVGLRRDVLKAWMELARAEAHAVQSTAGAEREEALAVITRSRFDAGDASHADVVSAEAASKRAAARAAGDRAAVAAAAAELAALVGWDPERPLSAAGGIPTLVEAPPLEALRARRANHPDVRVVSARVEAESARVYQARVARRPSLLLDLEAMLDDPTLPGNDYRVGLTIDLPLFGKGAAGVRAAEAHRRAVEIERNATLAKLDGTIVASYRRYQAARVRAVALEREVLPAQREAAELARTAYREGQAGLIIVVDADRALADVEVEAIDARADAATALAELAWAVGGQL
jgi:cobalt-zinc-cadmium efflux system outer membrane protein